MSFGPRPSQLCLLSHLPEKQVGDKVRFLGCVTSYIPASGVLALEHRLPEEARSVHALVDVNLVLESLGPEQTRVGEWVNVIGYITDIAPLADRGNESAPGTQIVHAQAVLLWSAGPFDIRRYEASLKTLTQTGSTRYRTPS
ncbi:hypothetical protein L209DRAFT_760719 [Thermothelomyces heterothallicus CBS 203.75]